MFVSEDIIGDIVFISIHDIKQFLDIGIIQNSDHYFVQGLDHLGLWVRHPGLIFEKVKGASLPKLNSSNDISINIEANFFIPWHQVKTLMHYPDREGFDFPQDVLKKKIGFKQGKISADRKD